MIGFSRNREHLALIHPDRNELIGIVVRPPSAKAGDFRGWEKSGPVCQNRLRNYRNSGNENKN